ncbi:MAG: VanZ family protein [Bryobacter sp.]|jgi:VanZ family protein|nr:VanZ family protein [Bryobacter sp. CoA8 C33]
MSFQASFRWACIAIYVAYVVTQHENVQVFLAPIALRIGRPLFYAIFGVFSIFLVLLACLSFWRSSAVSAARHSLRRHWAAALAATLSVVILLTVNNSEFVHFPQYFILAFLLFPFATSVGETVAWCTLTGLLDEGYQYFVIHPNWGVPWDFNDVTLDVCGGWLGAIWCASRCAAHKVPNPDWWRKPGLVTFFTSLATLPLLVALGKIQLYENKNYVGWWFALSRLNYNGFWFFDETWGPRTIHLLSPVEGPVLLFAFVLASSRIDRNYRFSR